MGIVARPRQTSSGWRAAEYGSTWPSQPRRGHSLRTRACSQGDGLMSCASTGRHRCAMVCRRWPSTLAAHGYDTAGFVANLDYCMRETGLARGFAHYEDFPLSLFAIHSPRYVALGRRIDVPTWASAIELFLEKHTGRWYDVLPHAKEHEKSAAAINSAFLGWLGKRPANGRPFFAFLNYNDAHSPYEVPDPSIPGFGLRPSIGAAAADFASVHRVGQDDALGRRRPHGQSMFMTTAFFIWIGSWGYCLMSSAGGACSRTRC